MTFDNEDYDTDSMYESNLRFDLNSPVLFGRGIWYVNGQTICIECAGWYVYRRGHWTWAEIDVEVSADD